MEWRSRGARSSNLDLNQSRKEASAKQRREGEESAIESDCSNQVGVQPEACRPIARPETTAVTAMAVPSRTARATKCWGSRLVIVLRHLT
jgi:hypothetical protein